MTGAISATVDSMPLTLYCVQNNVTVTVPGNYYAQNVGLQSNPQLQAAWLMATYGPSHTATDDSIALQLAIWNVLGVSYAPSDSYQTNEVSMAKALVTSIATSAPANLSYLQSSYSEINLYTDPSLQNPVQNQLGLIVADGANGSPTPIPAATWLLGSGLMGLFGLRRKEKV